ncbi:oleate hydratase [Pseudodonghicola xiamenensis]|uniref:Oleate hydratase n=1 Tax=Pseudodonghicola xiamenensis TaxID=337702 RepID=A0A8J3H9G2_9RHOB|nr:oleate hydratase [Pseudodonghicola xiamenensis]GHH04381.1 oleate hydratase [Pseudodonghicola xiamenensis]
MKAHIIGGGISALAAAAYLFRDAGVLGANIHIYEASDRLGGALDARGDAQGGYVMRGGRMFEAREDCIHDLMSFIPSRDDPTISIEDDLRAFNATYGWHNTARLLGPGGEVLAAEHFGLSPRNLLDLTELLLAPEVMLDGKSVADVLDLSILQTNFWNMFGSIFALLPWHSAIETRRYLRRFFHLLPTMASMTTIQRSRYNQYESLVEPLRDWLDRLGVRFHMGCTCEDVDFTEEAGLLRSERFTLRHDGVTEGIELAPDDLLFLTLGSHVADATFGDMTSPPLPSKATSPAWGLWHRLAGRYPGLGNPQVFQARIDRTAWVTFTITARGGPLRTRIESLSGAALGRGGLMTMTGAPWLLTLTGFHNPHFTNQPGDVDLFWGYGLYLDRPGSAVAKPMPACSGAEILTELAHHLGMPEVLPALLESCICTPVLMPYAGSVLMRRNKADRPAPVPTGYANLGLLGQFVEVPDEVVFTTEYAVRGARLAVAGLMGEGRAIPPVYLGQYDPHALIAALRALVG